MPRTKNTATRSRRAAAPKPSRIRMMPLADRLYLIESEIHDLKKERAELIEQMNAEYWPGLRDRLRAK